MLVINSIFRFLVRKGSRAFFGLVAMALLSALGSCQLFKGIPDEEELTTEWVLVKPYMDLTGRKRFKVTAESPKKTPEGVRVDGRVDLEVEYIRWNKYNYIVKHPYKRRTIFSVGENHETTHRVIDPPEMGASEQEQSPENIVGIERLETGPVWQPEPMQNYSRCELSWQALDCPGDPVAGKIWAEKDGKFVIVIGRDEGKQIRYIPRFEVNFRIFMPGKNEVEEARIAIPRTWFIN